MKIGELSNLTGVNIATIRYYISLGLLNPEQSTYQYDFKKEDCETLKHIIRLKSWGFPLKEIRRIQSILRFSTGVELQERVEYISMLINQREKLKQECDKLQELIAQLNEEIEVNQNIQFNAKSRGVPIQALEIICCPLCQASLELDDVSMNAHDIFEGNLRCQCGYTTKIVNGIIYSGLGQNSVYDKADLKRSLYRSCPSELSALIQKTYSWMTSKIQQFPTASRQVVMETHINSFFYLYNNLNELNPNSLYIIQDKFPEIIELYKQYIEQTGINLNILYIASSELQLPLKAGSVDLLIDYNSTNEHGIFFPDLYLKTIQPYLKAKANVIGTYFSFDPQSKSIRNLMEQYPENHPQNYTRSYLSKNIINSYRVVEKKEIGISLDSGEGITFIFHNTGDKMYIDSFHLELL